MSAASSRDHPAGQAGRLSPACLVVDDEDGVCRFITGALRRAGLDSASIRTATGIEAAFAERIPDLIFLDAALGQSDAVEAIRILERVGYRGPVQLMSGRPPDVIENIRQIGERRGLRMRPCLAKPFRAAEIVEVIRQEGLAGSATAETLVEVDASFDPDWLSFRYRPQVDPRTMRVCAWNGELHVLVPAVGVPSLGALTGFRSEAAVASVLRSLTGIAAEGARSMAGLGAPVTATFRIGLARFRELSVPSLAQAWGVADGAGSGLVKVEFGEDEILEDPAFASEIAAQWRLLGIPVVAADAGTRYLSVIGHKPISMSEVRVHPKLLEGCALERNRGRTGTMIDIIHRSGSTVLADGIADRADLAFLGRTGCERCQGPAVGPFAAPDQAASSPDGAAFASNRRTEARPFLFQDFGSRFDRRI